MRHTYIEAEREQQAFAERAARAFADEPKMYSFTDSAITPGALLALRWGMGEDCVLVLQLDDSHEPVIYGNLVRTASAMTGTPCAPYLDPEQTP